MTINSQNQTTTNKILIKNQFQYVVFHGFGIAVALANFMASSYYSSCCFFNCCSFASLPTPPPHTFPYLLLTLSLMGTMEFHLPKLGLAQGYVPSLTSSKVRLPQTVLKLKQSHPLLCQHSHKQFKKKQKKMTGFVSCRHLQLLSLSGYCLFLGFMFPSLRVE